MIDNEKYLTLKEVIKIIRLQRSAIRERVKDGRFPEPIKSITRKNIWYSEIIREFIRLVNGGMDCREATKLVSK